MTIDEAIHVQQLHLDGDPKLTDTKLRRGMKLGIEALKLLAQEPPEGYTCIPRPLPGETEY